MARFLNTKKAVSEIEDLIRNANNTLILMSPYLKLSKGFKELLKYRNSKDKITTVIFGKQELNPTEMKFLEGLRFVILKYNEDLHAKCYMNDNQMIITSLNLYDFSMINNKEMGVLIDKNDDIDKELFEDAFNELDYIAETSDRFKFTSVTETEDENKTEEKPQVNKEAYSKSKFLTTKEISQATGLSSRKINTWFVDNKLMYKKEDDWFATKKGNELGAKQKEGAYGKFIIWPENIVVEIKG